MTEVTEHAQITIYVNLDWKIYFTSKNIINVSRIIKPSLYSLYVNLDWKIYFTCKNIINVSRIIKPSLSSQHPA